jgi:glutamate synthase (NADPH/NADH) small chain
MFKAIGQMLVPDPIVSGAQQVLEMQDGKIAVDGDRKSSLPNVWAGGDCITGVDLTVQAVQDGKVAAHAIDRYLRLT